MNKNLIKNFAGKLLTFGPYLPASNQILTRFGDKMPKSWADHIFEKRYEMIMKKLDDIVGPLEVSYTAQPANDGPVWSSWLQGEDKMPLVVKLCTASMRKFVDSRPLNIITLDNLHNYIDLGGRIMDLYRKGRIDYVYFADLVRIRLLAQYGGLWADGTVLLTAPLGNEWFDMPFYSIKTEPTGRFVSRNRWTCFCMAAAKGSAVCATVDTVFKRYWDSQDWRIDYFLLDSAINLAYERVAQARKDIDAVPMNNPRLYDMRDMLCAPYDKRKFMETTSDTSVFKLNWRVSQDPRLRDPDSVFSHIKKMLDS